MPSAGGGSPFWGTSLSKRVRRLERAIQPDLAERQRAYLEGCFATPEYAGHRAAIREALLSDPPQRYLFTSADDPDGPDGPDGRTPMTYLISWPQREHLAPVVVRAYCWISDALL